MKFSIRFIAFICLGFLSTSALPERFAVGVGVHLGQEKITFDQVRALLSQMPNVSIRDEIFWHRVERKPGLLEIGPDLGGLMNAIYYSGSGAKALVILNYGNKFYGGGQPQSSDQRAAFRRYVEVVVGRLRGRVFGYEIWNEWNIGGGNPPGGPRWGAPELYSLLVQEAVPAIRKLDPGAHVTCGSLADMNMEWLGAFVKSSGFALCDSLSLHPYVFLARTRNQPELIFDFVSKAREVLVREGYGNKKILITEIGWPSHAGKGGHFDVRVASYLSQFYLMAPFAEGLSGAWWYELVDSGLDKTNKEHNFGLFDSSLAPKPPFYSFRFVSGILAKATPFSLQKNAPVRRVATYKLDAGGFVSAVWSANGDPIQLKVVVGDIDVARLMNGAEVDISSGFLVVDESPVYFFHRESRLPFRE